RNEAAPVTAGAAIQRALGIASGYESEADAAGAALVTRDPALDDARFETLRQLAAEAAIEIADALGGGTHAPPTAPDGDPVVAFRSRMLAVQAELAAPALLTQSTRDVCEVMQLVVQLALEPTRVSGRAQLVNALSASLGRRRRKKLRRILGEDAASGDYA